MGNSPSKNQYVIQSTNKQSQGSEGQQQLQLSEESSNDTNDPDDSRPQPTKSKNISITKPRNSTIISNGYNTTTSGGTTHRRSPYYDLKIEMQIARQNVSGAVDSSASISSSSMSSTASTSMSTCSSNISMKQLNSLSPSSSYPSPANLASLRDANSAGSMPETGSQKTTTGGSVLPTISEGGEHYKQEKQARSTKVQGLSPATSSSKKSISNPRSSSPVILRRNSHDPYNSDKLNIDDAIEKLLHIGETRCYHSHDFPFHSWEVQLICAAARKVFLDQPSLLRLQAPIKIVGDVHGQFTDLLRILKLSGVPHDTNYLFLGDYVDRGKQSLETIMLLLCYKIKYPDRFFMLRGNHESANVTKMYGFYDECKRRMSTKTWKQFVDVFNTLPFAAIVQDKIFCVHGGISPQLTNMKQIEKIARPTDIPEQGLLTDLLWSDPDPAVSDWSLNDRGISYTFGKRNVYDFCSNFKYDLIIRGHMVVEDGYEFFAKKKFVTVFSAPNYCGQFQNWGAVMSVTTGMMCSFELLKPHGMRDGKA